LLDHVVDSARMFGLENVANLTPDRWLDEGDRVEVGELSFDILHCPGHSPGSIAFVNAAQRLAIVGDVLYRSGAPTFPAAITGNCSNRSGTSSCHWPMTSRCGAGTGRSPRSAASGPPTRSSSRRWPLPDEAPTPGLSLLISAPARQAPRPAI
jgi:hypothetical protein